MKPATISKDTQADTTPQESKADTERKELLNELAKRIESRFQRRVVARVNKESEWRHAQSLYDSPLSGLNYSSPDKPFANDTINERRPTPNIVRTKCDTAIANSVSLQFAAGEKNWDLFPSANVNDPAVLESCRLMEKEIETQLTNTKYSLHCRRAMEERVILGTGVIKGPVNTGKLKVTYRPLGDGTWVPDVTDDKSPALEWVSVWRLYPDMSVTEFQDCSDVIELHPMTPLELSTYRKHPGFDKEAIDEILRGEDGSGAGIKPDIYNEQFEAIKASIWEGSPYLYRNRYQVLEYHGPVTYDELNKLGITPTYESPTSEYYGEVWVCCGKVIRMELENIEGFYETPYSLAVWKRDPTSLFGFGHPLLLADAQRVTTAAYHMVLDNASLTSGPQVAMYKKYIQPVDGNYNISPNKVWLLTDPSVPVENAIKFFNPTNVIGNIMPVMELARKFAEEESATLASPTQSPDNTDTATGALLMRHASNTNLDFSSEEWDDQVTEKVIRRYHAWNMQYNPKQEIKGDYVIDVKSSTEYKNKQMFIRDMERLSMEAAQNPVMAMALNMDELTAARLSMMHLPGNRIVRTKEEFQQAQQAAQQAPDPQMLELQLKQAELEMQKEKLKLETQELAFQLKQQQQRELWEHEEKMGSNKAREMEAQAQVLKARSEAQVEMLKLASKDRSFMAKLATDKEMKQLSERSRIFLKSMEEERKRDEIQLTAEELRMKAQTGSGI